MTSDNVQEKLPQENDLAQRFKAGEKKAFSELYDLMYPTLCYQAYNMVQDDQESQCIAAETLEKLYKIHANFDSMPSIRSFLYTVCYRDCCTFLKYGKQKKLKPIESVDEIEFSQNEQVDILERMVSAELVRRIFGIINEMPPQRKKLLQLIYGEGLSTPEVAEQLNISVESVWSTKAKALEDLRNRVRMTITDQQLAILLIAAFELQHFGQLAVSHALV